MTVCRCGEMWGKGTAGNPGAGDDSDAGADVADGGDDEGNGDGGGERETVCASVLWVFLKIIFCMGPAGDWMRGGGAAVVGGWGGVAGNGGVVPGLFCGFMDRLRSG